MHASVKIEILEIFLLKNDFLRNIFTYICCSALTIRILIVRSEKYGIPCFSMGYLTENIYLFPLFRNVFPQFIFSAFCGNFIILCINFIKKIPQIRSSAIRVPYYSIRTLGTANIFINIKHMDIRSHIIF